MLEWNKDQIESLMDDVTTGVLTKDLGQSAGISYTPAKAKVVELGLWDEYTENREARKQVLAEKGFDPRSTTEVYDRLMF